MTTTYESNMVLSTQQYNVVGTRPIRPDGTDKVTGRALYGADFQAAGLLYGSILRSPHAHARILSIDTSKAESLEGVKAVITALDIPKGNSGIIEVGEDTVNVDYLRRNILAHEKALYQGHAIAGVAATSQHIAQEALSLINVQYEVLTPVLTAPDGMKEDAPILLEELRTQELGEQTDKVSNLAEHFQHKKGDIDSGFKEADIIIEREFNTSTVHQGYIEPHPATAFWNQDGRLEIWCSTQGSFTVRDSVSHVLDIPVSKIKVTPMEIGGGFGGKIPVYLEPVAALLSKKSGHPVKIVMSRKEVFEGSGPTPGSYIKIKLGAKNNGKISAAQAYLAYEAGGFPGSPVSAGAQCVFAAYDVPNAVIDGYDVVVNKPKSAPYRAPGAPNAAFAVEQVITEIATKLKMDPIELRLINASKEGTRRPDGPVFPRIGCVEVLQAMADHPHYNAPLTGKNQGRGVGIGFWFNIGFESSCNLAVNSDGTLTLVEGSTDIGGSRASIGMQAAEVLGIPAEDVRATVVDTDSVGFTAVTGGSRTTYATGWAAHNAAVDVKTQIIERASKIWDVPEDQIQYDAGKLIHKSDPQLTMTFKEIADQLKDTGGPIVGRSAINAGGAGAGGGSFAGVIVDVEVDPDTGKVTILRFTSVQDAGKAIHPSYVEGQMQGGSVQGIGWALNEEYFMTAQGQMTNSTLLDYRMPTSLDIPMIDTVIVEVPSSTHPFGVRGVGEANIVPPTPAIANAITDAIDVPMDSLPMNPVAVLKAIWNKSD